MPVLILGDLKSDNSIHPSGYEALITSSNDKDTYQVIIGNTSLENSKYNEPVFNLMSIMHDGTRTQSNIERWQPSVNMPPQYLQSKAVDVWNGEDYGGRRVDLYEVQMKEGYKYAGTDDEGNVLASDGTKIIDNPDTHEIIPSEVTPEQLISANRNLNPYLPSRLNKKQQNE